MYAYRTVITRIGYACAVGCLLVGAPALAAVNSNGIELLSSSSTGVKTGQYIEAAASVRYQHVNTAQRIYTKALVPVASSTLRRGALAALGAGMMHPGFHLAIAAAGFAWTLADGIHKDAPVMDTLDDTYNVIGEYSQPAPAGQAYSFNGDTYTTPLSVIIASANLVHPGWIGINLIPPQYGNPRYRARMPCSTCNDGYSTGSTRTVTLVLVSATGAELTLEDDSVKTPVAEEDYPLIDEHIPPQLYDELWNGGPIPAWQDEITVLGAPATYVQPTGDQAVAPEVATKAGRWAENVAASLDGLPEPNPETGTDTMTAEEKIAEELDLDGPVPPYPSPEVDWQTETLTLPAYSSGIGDGVCPPPASIPLPLGGGTLDWSYQPACDLAGMARPAFLGACGLIALLIVLRARGGSD